MANYTTPSGDANNVKHLISELKSYAEGTAELDRDKINRMMDDLNVLNINFLSPEEKFACVRSCCNLVEDCNAMLVGKCAQVMSKLLCNEKLAEHMVIFVVKWCLKWLPDSSDLVQIEILNALERFISSNTNYCEQMVNEILAALEKPIENRSKLINPGELLLSRLECVSTIVPATNTSHYDLIKDILVRINQNELPLDDKVKAKIVLSQLEILTILSEKNTSWLSDNLGVVLGITLAFSSYGLPHHGKIVPQYLFPTTIPQYLFPTESPNVDPSRCFKNRRKKKTAKPKIKAIPYDDIVMPVLNLSQTSESDLSDTDYGGRRERLQKCERKVRLVSFSLLLLIVQSIDKREMIGYWSNILKGPYSILKTLSADIYPKSRVIIVTILNMLFSSGKVYLSQAQHSCQSENISYVPWCQLLADMISETHAVLCAVLNSTAAVGAVHLFDLTLSIVQCFAVLLRTVPYHRIKYGSLVQLVGAICPLLKLRSGGFVDNIRIAAVKCVTEIVTFEPGTKEQLALVGGEETAGMPHRGEYDSWIVSFCINSIKDKDADVNLRAECWTLLGTFIKHHFDKVDDDGVWLKDIYPLLRRDLNDGNVILQQKAAKAFEYVAIPLRNCDRVGSIDTYDLWDTMLRGPLVPMLQSPSGVLASSAANCIANISSTVFEKLPESTRIFIMTALCGCTGHEEHIARSAAVRTLGTIVVFPFLSKSIQIIYDVADRIVCTMNDGNLNVRTRAAWALGNLSDVLLSGRDNDIPIKEVPLAKILEQAIKTGTDHEKVKASSMRAVGNILLLVQKDDLENAKIYRQLIVDAAATLTHNACNENNMKVRWNACYSLGNMFKNETVFVTLAICDRIRIFELLAKLIVSCSNFKVRQAAANALSALASRELYGEFYSKLWPSLMTAFDNAEQLPEFSEYKHQQNLIDQLCLLLCHLCRFVNKTELDELSTISTRVELYSKYVAALKSRVDEVVENFENSATRLRKLRGCNLNSRQLKTVDDLLEIIAATKHSVNDDLLEMNDVEQFSKS